MSTALVAWELGAGMGHVMRAAALARSLSAAGYEVVVAMPDLADAARLNWPTGTRLVAAPQPRRQPADFANPASYAELLYASGYHDATQVVGLVTAWFNLLELAAADVLIADHAPAAHLAARIQNVAHVRIGSGFFAPPAGPNLPPYRDWHAIDEMRSRTIETHVLGVLNGALQAAGVSAAPSVGAALAPDLELITSAPEFDCYRNYRSPGDVFYLGHEAGSHEGVAAAWPQTAPPGKKRVVAYLKADYPALPHVLAALARNFVTVAYVSGMREDDRHRLSGESIWFAPQPIRLEQEVDHTDVFVCHAGAASAPLFLARGKPVLLLPYSAEQRVNASSMAATGAALWLAPDGVDGGFERALAHLSHEEAFARAARVLADRWAATPDAIESAAIHIGALLKPADQARMMQRDKGTPT